MSDDNKIKDGVRENIKIISKEFLETINSNNKAIRIISHYDTDGITSAAIITSMLKKMNKIFWISIVPQLTDEVIDDIASNMDKFNSVMFLDLGSSKLKKLEGISGNIFVIDHHEINDEDKNKDTKVKLINPHLFHDKDQISAAGLCYLFAKELGYNNMLKLAIIGMIGDRLDKDLSSLTNELIMDAKNKDEIVIKKGPTIFSSTRPLHKALEFSSDIYIPGVTGSSTGTMKFLETLNIPVQENGNYRTLSDLKEDEISKLITSIILRRLKYGKDMDIIGNIYLVKIFNQVIDAREVSALINACGRLERADVALAFCLGDEKAKSEAQRVYNVYKHELIKGLNWANNDSNVIKNENYMIINAGTEIKASVIGVVCSIIASSGVMKVGSPIIGLAYNGDQVKVSARISGYKDGINLKKMLEKISKKIGIEIGGHEKAAGAIFHKRKENDFLELLQQELELETAIIKIK